MASTTSLHVKVVDTYSKSQRVIGLVVKYYKLKKLQNVNFLIFCGKPTTT